MKTILLTGLTYLAIQAVVILFFLLDALGPDQQMVPQHEDGFYDLNDWGI